MAGLVDPVAVSVERVDESVALDVDCDVTGTVVLLATCDNVVLPLTVLLEVWPDDCVIGEDDSVDVGASVPVLDDVVIGVIDAVGDISAVTLVLDTELGIVLVLPATVLFKVVAPLLVDSLVDCIVLPPVLL